MDDPGVLVAPHGDKGCHDGYKLLSAARPTIYCSCTLGELARAMDADPLDSSKAERWERRRLGRQGVTARPGDSEDLVKEVAAWACSEDGLFDLTDGGEWLWPTADDGRPLSPVMLVRSILGRLGLERLPGHGVGDGANPGDIDWCCAAHSEGLECCADAPNVYRLTLMTHQEGQPHG